LGRAAPGKSGGTGPRQLSSRTSRKARPLRLSRLLINRNYARLWYGEAASALGDFVFDTTLEAATAPATAPAEAG